MGLTPALSLLTYILINCFTPGPGNLLAMNTMIRMQWHDGKRVLFGIFTGYYSVQILCAFIVYGLAKYLSPVFVVMKYAGVLYIIWLAVHILRSRPEFSTNNEKGSFRTGFLLQFVNIKIYFFGITALSGYVIPYYNKFYILLGVVIFIATIGSIATTTWALTGKFLQKLYIKHFKIINIILALFLLECVISLLTTQI